MVSKEQLELIIKADNLASKVIESVGGDIDKFSNKVNSLKNDALQGLQNGFAKTIDFLKGATTAIALASTAISAYGFNLAVSYESQLSNIRALTGATADQMKQISDLSMELGAKTKFSSLEAAQGAEELLKAGVSLEQVMGGGLAGALSLAAAGGVGVAEAAEIASTVLNAFRSDALSVADAADILAGAANASATSVGELRFGLSMSSAVASAVGLTFKDTSTALAVFAQNGLKGSDAGTSLKTMLLNLQPKSKAQVAIFEDLGLATTNVGAAAKYLTTAGFAPLSSSTEDVIEAMKKYVVGTKGVKEGTKKFSDEMEKAMITTGLTSNAFFTNEGKIKDLSSIAGTLKEKLSGLTDQQRLSALETMFGTDAIRAANILYKEGADGVKNMTSEMTKFTAEGVAAEKTNNLAGAFERLKGTIDTQLIKVFSEPLPDLTKWIGKLDEALQKVDAEQLAKSLGKALDSIEKVINFVVDNYQAVAIGLSVVAGAWIGLQTAMIYFSIVAAGANLGVVGLIPSLIALAAAGWAVVAPFIPFLLIGAAVIGLLTLLYFGFKDNFLGIRDIATLVLNSLISFFSWAFNTVINGVVTSVVTIYNTIAQYLSSIWQNWSNIFTTIQLFMAAIFLTIVGIFTGNGQLIQQAWQALGNKLWEVWGSTITLIQIGAMEFWNIIVYIFNSIVNSVVQTFIGLYYGIIWWWNTAIMYIINSALSIPNSIIGSFTKTKDGITNTFDQLKNINLYEIGRNIVQGMINGVGSMVNNLMNTVKDMANSAVDTAKKTLGIKSPSKVMMGLGEYTVQGFTQGIDQTMKQVEQSSTTMANSAALSVKDSTESSQNNLSTEKQIDNNQNNDNSKVINVTIQNIGNIDERQATEIVRQIKSALKRELAI